jgi:FlaA1/EpsC-like NDP-sugar epimerase
VELSRQNIKNMIHRLCSSLRSLICRGSKKTVIVAGAGDAGAMILKELHKDTGLGIRVLGFVDDDRAKLSKEVYGAKVLGTTEDLEDILKAYSVDEVIIVMPTAPGTTVRRLVNACSAQSVKTTILPAILELASGNVSISHLRAVQVEDLLRRGPIRIDSDEVAEYLNYRRILITGGAGSIGSEICRQVARFQPDLIAVFDNSENNLYRLELEMRKKYPDVTFAPLIGSIQDRCRVDQVFRRLRPHVVFHAAAHKHVPMMEYNPSEAVKNNIFGTKIVAEVADRHRVERFVLISTDKAVNPANVMGATKRAAEMVVQYMNEQSPTRFMAVRFANVLGSDGSVVPLFKKQIAEGGPVTITHPEVTRYFMTITEACQLVLQAGAIGKGGEVMILDMGQPTRIKDLAEDLIRFSGYEPGRDIEIKYIGLRPGERLSEELLLDEESSTATRHEKIYIANLAKYDVDKFISILAELETASREGRDRAVRLMLEELIETYHPGETPVALVTARLDS